MADVERVLHEGVTIEAETRDKRHRCYFLRILPYRARRRERSEGAGPQAGPDGVVLTLTDISALEQARSRLAQLSAIVESSDDAIIGTGLDGVVTTWNDAASRLYGYTAGEAVGRHASFLYPPALKDEIDQVVRGVGEGRPVERLETVRIRKDGTPVDVSVTYSPILDAGNRIVGVSAIARDIAALVRARGCGRWRSSRIRPTRGACCRCCSRRKACRCSRPTTASTARRSSSASTPTWRSSTSGCR
jgi:PAS domain S-box-containing protein